MTKSTLTSILTVALMLVASHVVVAAPTFTLLGDVTNDSNPSEWTSHSFDISSLISTATNAELSFDLRNDGPNPPYTPDATTSQVSFGMEDSDFSVRFNYLSGKDTSHWRNVKLDVDGLLYLDQFGDFNDHLGHEFLGTAREGTSGARNILGQTGIDAATYIMSNATPITASDVATTITSPVPLPAAGWFFMSGLVGFFAYGRNSRPRVPKV